MPPSDRSTPGSATPAAPNTRGSTTRQALAAFQRLAREEGILPALESSHAIAHACRLAPSMPKDAILLVNLSGPRRQGRDQRAKALAAATIERRTLMARTRRRVRRDADDASTPGLVAYVTAGRSRSRADRGDPGRARATTARTCSRSASRSPIRWPTAPSSSAPSERALASGTTLRGTLEMIRRSRVERSARRSSSSPTPTRPPHGRGGVRPRGRRCRRRRRAGAGPAGRRGGPVPSATRRRGARSDLPAEPDNHRRADPGRRRISAAAFST